MASKNISRLTAYITGQTINADEHNAEHQQYVDNFNELFKSFDYDGNFHYLLSDKTKFTFSNLNLEQILSSSHNADGTVKATKVVDSNWSVADLKSFLDISHNPDGTIKSNGIDDPLIYAHNNDTNSHLDIRNTVFKPPFIAGNSGNIAGSNIVLKAAASYSPYDKFSNVSYEWILPDGTVYIGDSVTWTIPATAIVGDIYTFKCRASDELGNYSNYSEFTVTVTDNQSPTFTYSFDKDVKEDNTTYTLTINATDIEGDILSYNVYSTNPFISVQQDTLNNNVFYITVTEVVEPVNIDIIIEVSDGINTVSDVYNSVVYPTKNKLTLFVHSKDIQIGYGVISLSSEFIYLAGYLYNSYTATGYVVVYKFDKNLNYIKHTIINAAYRTYSIKSDNNGNIFLLTTDGLFKLDSDLNIVNAVSISNFSANSNVSQLDVDQYDNVYVVFSYYNSAVPQYELHLVKFDNNLNIVAQTGITDGTTSYRYYNNTIKIDSLGNIYIVCDYLAFKFDTNLNLVANTYTGLTSALYIDIDDANNFLILNSSSNIIARYDLATLSLIDAISVSSLDKTQTIVKDVKSTTDGYFCIYSNGTNYGLVKFDVNLIPVNSLYIKGFTPKIGIGRIINNGNNIYILGTLYYIEGTSTYSNYFLLKTNNALNSFNAKDLDLITYKNLSNVVISTYAPATGNFTPTIITPSNTITTLTITTSNFNLPLKEFYFYGG